MEDVIEKPVTVEEVRARIASKRLFATVVKKIEEKLNNAFVAALETNQNFVQLQVFFQKGQKEHWEFLTTLSEMYLENGYSITLDDVGFTYPDFTCGDKQTLYISGSRCNEHCFALNINYDFTPGSDRSKKYGPSIMSAKDRYTKTLKEKQSTDVFLREIIPIINGDIKREEENLGKNTYYITIKIGLEFDNEYDEKRFIAALQKQYPGMEFTGVSVKCIPDFYVDSEGVLRCCSQYSDCMSITISIKLF